MSTRRHVLLYEPRFAPLAVSGIKRCTVRRRRLATPRPGDLLDHREWVGMPYRPGSTKRKIREDVCTRCRTIEIDALEGLVWLDDGDYLPSPSERGLLAQRDGFESFEQFADYFKADGGLPWHGLLIEWGQP